MTVSCPAGHANADDSLFCGDCGAKLAGTDPPTAPTATDSPAPHPAAEQRSADPTRPAPSHPADSDSPGRQAPPESAQGVRLADHVAAQGALAATQLHALALGLADVLAARHDVGTVHGHLSPDSVLLTHAGPRVLDADTDTAVTPTTMATAPNPAGPPGWMAPEQARGDATAAAGDVFSWGRLIAFAAGADPFGQDRPDALLDRTVHDDPNLSALAHPLHELVGHALTNDPELRPTASQLRHRLLADPATVPVAAPADVAGTPTGAPAAAGQVAPAPAHRPRFRRLVLTGMALVGVALVAFAVTALFVSSPLLELGASQTPDGTPSSPEDDAATSPDRNASDAPEPGGDEEDADDRVAPDDAAPPVSGQVTMARANWDTGYFQAEIYYQLLTELGYDVTHPSHNEMGADVLYTSMGEGGVDFAANGWFPLHDDFVGPNVETVGTEVPAGAVQGYLIDKATARDYDITSIEQIDDNPRLAQLFDVDGDGQADLVGCNAGWGCFESIEQHFASNNGLGDNMSHLSADYAGLLADTIARYERGRPILYYTWTPNWSIDALEPGQDVVWLEARTHPDRQDPLPASHLPGGPGACAGAPPCDLGWAANDIKVIANSDFLDTHPAAETLFEEVELSVSAISAQNAKMQDGQDSHSAVQRHASDWIDTNRHEVDDWLDAARRAVE